MIVGFSSFCVFSQQDFPPRPANAVIRQPNPRCTMHSDVLAQIIETIRTRFGIRTDEAFPIQRGYLNEKWILHTNRGKLFAKCYSIERYQRHLDTIWGEIDQALNLQMVYYRSGGVCPKLCENEQGGFLHETSDGNRFVLMTCCPGENIAPGQVSEGQMHSLGIAVGMMHRVWNTGAIAPPPETLPLWRLNINEIKLSWEERWAQCQSASEEVRRFLLLQKEVLDSLDDAPLEQGAPGWAHLDLWTENMLFAPDRLSAIVDFDRVRFTYVAMDLGRVVLSCALHEGTLRRDAIAAFAEGYRTAFPLARKTLLHAVRHNWLIEASWWIRPSAASWSAAPRRFQQEMVWTAFRWARLEDELGGM